MSARPPETFVRPERAEEDGSAKLQLKVGGMHCSLCTESIHKGLTRLEGVEDARVSIAHEEALIRYDPARIGEYEIRETLADLGYTARDPEAAEILAEEEEELAVSRRKAMLSGGLLAAASALMGAMLVAGENILLAAAMGALSLFLFLGPARFIIFRNGLQSARRGILNQDVLVSAAAAGGLIGGSAGLFVPAFPSGGFFGATVFVLSFHLIGGYASVLVHVRASQSVRKLLDLEPPTARRVEDGREEEVPLEELVVDDLVRVRPGERVPVDGVIEEGTSAVDESLVSGESVPRDKMEGDEVIGGSLNQAGAFVMRVSRVGEETFLRSVARQVAEARALKPGILRLVDRVLLFFVPAVFGASALGFLLWTAGAWLWAGEPDFLRAGFAALGVLVMGYPCALGMATPLAIIRGSGEAAERGFLMRSGEAFHVFKDVKKVVLDKTGTITRGEPSVAEVVALDGYDEAEALSLAAAAESPSEHPLARAVVEAAEERSLEIPPIRDFDTTPGKGVRAEVEGLSLAVGSPRFVEDEGADLSPLRERIEDLQGAGNTVVVLAVGGEAAALVTLADRVKDDARKTIASLKKAGLSPVMLTGDNERTARAVAERVGISEYRAEVLPEDKARVVREMQEEGFRVAMVGDGINDAPALMQSDLGIAIGAGTDVAVDAADIVVTGEKLSTLVEARDLAGRSYRLTFTNVALALTFNGVGVMAAVSGLVAPVWAMLAMAASVSLVLLNSFAGRLFGGGEEGASGP